MEFIYVVLIVLQIACLVNAMCKKTNRNWGIVFGASIFSILASVVATFYIDNLPNQGIIGFAHMGEVVYGMGTVVISAVILLVSIILCVIQKKIRKS